MEICIDGKVTIGTKFYAMDQGHSSHKELR